MKYKAVVFDLFGTLIPSFSQKEYREIVMRIARDIPAPPEDFWRLWSDTFNQSILGLFPNYEAKIKHICQELGVDISELKIKVVALRMSTYAANSMVPRPEAVEVLTQLKSKGLRIGLVTDCAADAPAAWKNTPIAPYFDVTIFSCSVGMRKPDPRIYELVTKKLGVDPEDCVYIGDGGSYELSGASRVGMQAVQLRAPGEDNPDVYVVDKEDWQGRRIRSLTEIAGLLDTQPESEINKFNPAKEINWKSINLKPAKDTDREFAYQVKKAAEGTYITELWGWDEGVQRNFHAKQWQENRPNIIFYGNRPIGTLAVNEKTEGIEVAQFFILPEFQNRGIGTFLMRQIVERADQSGRKIRLRYLKNNPVATFYLRLGFQIVDPGEVFNSMERQIQPI
jgi:putative hydrolase of the HAD superfamily